MKTDANPSILFLGYSKPDKKKLLFQELKKNNFNFREVYLIDVEIPLNQEYDNKINFFKHFINPNYIIRLNPIKSNPVVKFYARKIGYNPIQVKQIWRNDNKHPLLYSLLFPLFYQEKKIFLTSSLEKKNYEKLKYFKSDNYKPKLSGILDEKRVKFI